MSREETWLWVPDYEGLYMVSDLGRVMRAPDNGRRGHLMNIGITIHGYEKVCLSKNNERRHHAVHRLVAMAFVPNRDGKPEVNHKNGNRTDNRADNLEWVTRGENELHAYRVLGKRPTAYWKGKANPSKRLFSAEQIRRIRSDKRTSTAIAREYGVSKVTILNIKKYKVYKEVV